MARQYKRIQQKISPKVKKAGNTFKPKQSRDLMLIILICLTLVVLLMAWHNLDNLVISMYISLIVSMLIVYANRHGNFSEKEHLWLSRLSLASIVVCLGLFAATTYFQFMR